MIRTKKITIRLNDIEMRHVRENANTGCISISEYIRNLINGGTTTPPLESIINNQTER